MLLRGVQTAHREQLGARRSVRNGGSMSGPVRNDANPVRYEVQHPRAVLELEPSRGGGTLWMAVGQRCWEVGRFFGIDSGFRRQARPGPRHRKRDAPSRANLEERPSRTLCSQPDPWNPPCKRGVAEGRGHRGPSRAFARAVRMSGLERCDAARRGGREHMEGAAFGGFTSSGADLRL